MNRYWWIKLNKEAIEISKEDYIKKRNHNLKAITGMNTYMIVEDCDSYININKWGWIPDIPKEALKKILNEG